MTEAPLHDPTKQCHEEWMKDIWRPWAERQIEFLKQKVNTMLPAEIQALETAVASVHATVGQVVPEIQSVATSLAQIGKSFTDSIGQLSTQIAALQQQLANGAQITAEDLANAATLTGQLNSDASGLGVASTALDDAATALAKVVPAPATGGS